MGKLLAAVASLVLGLGTVSAIHAVADPRFPLLLYKTGTTYPQARRLLIKDGWKPYRPHGSEGCVYDVCKAYPETASCGGMDVSTCVFTFQRGTEFIRVWGHDVRGIHAQIEGTKCKAILASPSDGIRCEK